MSAESVLLLIFLFVLKHLIIDFPLQGEFQWKNKGTYGHLGGILHAGLHTVGTFAILIFFCGAWASLALSILDGLIHYHIDWAKMNINTHYKWQPNTSPEFWWLLGLDQFFHYSTYCLIIWFLI